MPTHKTEILGLEIEINYDLEEKEEKIYSRELCCFEYRNSIFKKEKKNKFFITHVEFILNKNQIIF